MGGSTIGVTAVNMVTGASATGWFPLGDEWKPTWQPKPSQPLAEAILRIADGEAIEGVIIRPVGKGTDYESSLSPEVLSKYDVQRGVVLPWHEVRPLLAHMDDDDFDAFYVWTTSKVIFGCTYEGDSWVESLPRNPVAFEVTMIGEE